MKHTKRSHSWRIGLISCAAVVAGGHVANGEAYDCGWVHPCSTPDDLTCASGVCWCEAEWDDATYWTPFVTCGDYPDDIAENARILHSNNPGECDHGPDAGEDCLIDDDCENVCVGGIHHGETCTSDFFCTGFTQAPAFCDFALCEIEAYLLIGMADEVCEALRLEVKDTAYSPDRLDVRFDSICVGGTDDGDACTTDANCASPGICGNTLDMLSLHIEGEAGNVSLTLDGATELYPDAVTVCGNGGTSTLTVLSGTKLQTDTTD